MDKKPIRKKKYHFKPEKTFICDFETTTNNTNWYKSRAPDAEQVRITYWYAKSWDGTLEFEGTNIDTFMQFVFQHKGAHVVFYFHNLSFDGEFIYYWLSKNKPDKYVGIHLDDEQKPFIKGYELEETKSCFYWRIKKGYYSIFQNGSRIMNISIGNHDGKHYQHIDICCSLRLLSAPVSLLAKSFGFEKMTEEDKEKGHAFYDVEPLDNLEEFKKQNKNYVEYCKRDVEAVRLSLIEFKKVIDDLPFVKNKNLENDKTLGINLTNYMTIASLGRDLLENVFVKGFQYGYKIKKENGKYELIVDKKNRPIVNKTASKKYCAKNIIKFNADGLDVERKVGNMVKIDMYTHNQFDEPHYYQKPDGTGIKDDVWDKFYKGGLTQFNPNYFNWKDIGRSCKLDVSSAYPYHMTKPLPYGSWIDEEDFFKNHYKKDWKPGIDYIEFVKVYVKKCVPKEANKHCCVLPNWTNAKVEGINKVYRKNPNVQENFIVCTTLEEWEEYQNWADFTIEKEKGIDGKLYQRIEKYYMYAAPFLEQISKILYDLKDYYSKIKDNGKKLGTKIFLNSLYGSLALGLSYDNIMYTNNDVANLLEKQQSFDLFNTQFNNFKEYEFKGYSSSRNFNNQTAIKINYTKNKSNGFNKAAGAVITSYERVYLMQTIRAIGAEYFGYCDTDSILFVNLTKDKLKELVKLSKSKSGLGSWEFEETYIYKYRGAGAKKYMTFSIPCDISENGEDTFYNFDEKGNKIYFDNAEQAIKYAEEHNKFYKSSKIAGITQENDNDTILDFNPDDLKKEETFYKVYQDIWEKQDKTYKLNHPLTGEQLKKWYELYLKKNQLPIIAGNKTSIRVKGGRLIITDVKLLDLNKEYL